MKREWSPMRDVNVIAKLADLSEVQYTNALILHALVELLVKKGVLTRHELAEQVRLLDERTNAILPRVAPDAAPTPPPVG